MKKLLLTMLFLCLPMQAWALVVDVAYTGIVREVIDTCGYGCGIGPGISYTSNLMYAGGPIANNSLGYAQQFTVSQKTIIDYLFVSAHIQEMQNEYSNLTSSNTMYFKLYTGTKDVYRGEPTQWIYPDVNTPTIESSFLATTYLEDVYFPEYDEWHTFDRERYYIDDPIPFDITLDPGTYWIAQERFPGGSDWFPNLDGRHDKVDGISVKFGQNDLNAVHTPEPVTLLMVGGGLIGMAWKRRRP